MLCLWPKFFIYLLGLFRKGFFFNFISYFSFFLDHTTWGSGVIKKETQKSNQTQNYIASLYISFFTDI